MEWFYDRHGKAVFFKYNDRLIDRLGQNLCWISGNCVYSLRAGRHIGWFEEGKIYDIDNGILAFLQDARGLPYRPGIDGAPGAPGIPGKPGRPGFGGTCGRPAYHGFSELNAVEYFFNNQ